LNFIRYSCHDTEWVTTSEKLGNTGGSKSSLSIIGQWPNLVYTALKYSDIAGLERSIDAAYHIAGQRLFEVFLGKFKLLDHLSALKNYLMLGHGDFIDRLMEALGYILFAFDKLPSLNLSIH
jgi:gamma-tubulin complex component 3